MNDLRKAAEMALDALMQRGEHHPKVYQAAEALRQALDDKPAVKSYCGGKLNYCVPLQSERIRIDPVTGDVGIGTVDAVNMTPERVDETAKGEHEPIGYIDGMHGGYMVFTPINPSAVYLNGTALYTAPPKKEWVGLTDKDKDAFWRADQMTSEEWGELFAAVEAKLKEKNGG